MDLPLFDLLKGIIIVVIVLGAVGQVVYSRIIKPLMDGMGSGGPATQSGRKVKDFLDELRRDLGHGESPEPRTDGLLEPDDERTPAPLAESRPRPIAREEPEAPAERPPARRPAPQWERTALDERLEALRRRRTARAAPSAVAAPPPPARPAQPIAPVHSDAGEDSIASSTAQVLRRKKIPRSVLGADLETAIILREVFGPPRCMQPYRRAAPRSRR